MSHNDLLQQELDLELPAFSQLDAYRLGSRITEKAIADGHTGVVDIRTPSNVLYHVAFGGATADNDSWIARKSAVALRFQASSLRVASMIENRGDVFATGWLSATEHAPVGGAFPIRVVGAGVVAVITTSGLGMPTSEHELLAAAIDEYRLEAATS